MNGNITISGVGTDVAARQADGRNKQVIFKPWAPFTACLSQTNKTQVNRAKDRGVVMPM